MTAQLFNEALFRENVPPEMLAASRWVRFFIKPKADGVGTAKIPIGARRGEVADSTDESTWGTFDECIQNLDNDQQGLGYMLKGGDVHCLDIDHCRNPRTGQICNEAMLLLSRIPSWAEFSVSGTGIHVFFKGDVRGKELTTTCLQYWHPGKTSRFIALTCDMVGDAFKTLRDIGHEFNYCYSTARHISAKIREELKEIDPEQWKNLPVEREAPEPVREKSKTKTRKVAAGFDIYDFLKFHDLPIDNECDNELGHCIRLTTCPIKGEPHVGQNSTTTNFIYPCKDGGLAFHCQSTGCIEASVHDVISQLAKDHKPYPKAIYETSTAASDGEVFFTAHSLDDVIAKQIEWVVKDRIPRGMLTYLFAPKGRGKTKLCNYFNKLVNDAGLRVIRFNMEDSEDTILKPCLHAAGYNSQLTSIVNKSATFKQDDKEMSIAVNFSDWSHIHALRKMVNEYGDVGLVIIEPINNYKGKAKAISEDDMRPIFQGLSNLAEELNVAILVISHTNKKKDVDVQEKSHGSTSSINVARVNWFLDRDPNGEKEDRLLTDAGCNIPVGKSLAFKITQVPTFELDGITFNTIAIADHFAESDVTAAELLEEGESPSRKSKSDAIAAWLVEFMLGKGPMDSAVVIKAGKQIDKDWSENNIRVVFNRRKMALGATSHSKGKKGRGNATIWEIGASQRTFDRPEFDHTMEGAL